MSESFGMSPTQCSSASGGRLIQDLARGNTPTELVRLRTSRHPWAARAAQGPAGLLETPHEQGISYRPRRVPRLPVAPFRTRIADHDARPATAVCLVHRSTQRSVRVHRHPARLVVRTLP